MLLGEAHHSMYVMVIFMVIDCDDHIGWDDDLRGKCYLKQDGSGGWQRMLLLHVLQGM